MTVNGRIFREWEAILSQGMPEGLRCKLERNRSRSTGPLVAFNFYGFIDAQPEPVLLCASTIDFAKRETRDDGVFSDGHKFGLHGLGLRYVWNYATEIAPALGINLCGRAGATTGGSVWQMAGYELNYPEHLVCKTSSDQLKTLSRLLDARYELAAGYCNDPVPEKVLAALKTLRQAAIDGYVKPEDSRVLWDIVDDKAVINLAPHLRLDLSPKDERDAPAREGHLRYRGQEALLGTIYEHRFNYCDQMALRRMRAILSRNTNPAMAIAA